MAGSLPSLHQIFPAVQIRRVLLRSPPLSSPATADRPRNSQRRRGVERGRERGYANHRSLRRTRGNAWVYNRPPPDRRNAAVRPDSQRSWQFWRETVNRRQHRGRFKLQKRRPENSVLLRIRKRDWYPLTWPNQDVSFPWGPHPFAGFLSPPAKGYKLLY